MLIFRNRSLTSAIDKATTQSGNFFESFLENTFRFFWNRKKTTYQETSKNSFEYGAGWTYSNGHPLSADPSQIIWKIDPDEFNIFYEGYSGAMTVGKVSEIPTTTWYTDHKFNNNKFFHDYSTGDVFVNDGSLTLFGSNENINLSAANTGIRILNGNITSSLGNIHLSSGNIVALSGDLDILGDNKGVYIKKGGVDIDQGYVDIKEGFILVRKQTTVGNAAQINQTVVGDASTVNQSNLGNASTINQLSAGNAFTVNQNAIGNATTINQLSSGNALTVNQNKNGNGFTLTQSGSGNALTLNQSGSGIAITVNQSSNYKGIVLNQSGRGDGLTINQSASGNSFTVMQSADGNSAIINHFRNGNLLTLNHSGSGVGLTLNHSGSGVGLTLNHSGSGVVAVINQNLNYDGMVLNQFGRGDGLTINQSGSGVALTVIQSSNDPAIFCTGNIILSGNNKQLNNTGNGSIINTFQLSAFSLSADRVVYTGSVINEKNTISTTTIDCSLGNYFEYNTTVNSQNFVFSNVPQNPNTVYVCTLKCTGSVTTDDFPNNVEWSRRSFYYEYYWSSSDYIRNGSDLNGDGNSDTHIITFTTWNNGTTWYADDVKYAP